MLPNHRVLLRVSLVCTCFHAADQTSRGGFGVALSHGYSPVTSASLSVPFSIVMLVGTSPANVLLYGAVGTADLGRITFQQPKMRKINYRPRVWILQDLSQARLLCSGPPRAKHSHLRRFSLAFSTYSAL